jgi:hypothetical protein
LSEIDLLQEEPVNPFENLRTERVIGDELDRIGQLGEVHFTDLCLKAKLKCSKVEPDKTGKDFVVETALGSASPTKPLDMRPPPIQIVVQVKTILAKNHTVRISLSVAERLAKDLRPTIICIFRIAQDDSINEMTFLHLVDEELAHLLKGLRRASSKGTVNPHEKTISLKVPANAWVESSPSDFCRLMAALPGGNMITYAQEKHRQLEELGFDDSRYSMRFSLNVASQDELIDGFLGLSPLSAEQVTIFERRFKIPLPIESGSGSGVMHFTPEHKIRGSLELRSHKSDERVKVTANLAMIGPPVVSEENIAISSETVLGRIIMGNGRWTYRFPEDFNEDNLHTATVWGDYFRFQTILSGGAFDITLEAEGNAPLKMSVDEPRDTSDAFERYAAFVDKLRIIVSAIGQEDLKFPISIAREQSRQLVCLARMLEATDTRFVVPDDLDPPLDLADDKSAYVSAVNVLGVWVGVFFPMIVTTREVSGVREIFGRQSTQAILERLDQCRLQENFERFRNKYETISGVNSIFVQMPGQFTSDTVTVLECSSSTEISS